MVDIATLTDNFDDNSKDGAKWGTNGNPFGAGTTGVTVAETSAQLRVTPAASQSTEFTSGYISANFYDLTASAAYVRIANAPQANGLYVYFRLSSGGGAGLGFDIENGTVYVRDNSNTLTTFAYNSTTHAWFRVRESGGSVFWDTASTSASDPPSSGDWTNRHSTSGYSTDHTSVKVYLGAGTYLSIGSPGTAQFDGFNTATTSGAAAYSVGPASASYSINGSGIVLRADRLVQPAAANVSVTGSGVTLLRGYLIQAASANISLTGSGVEFPRTAILGAAAANINIAGSTTLRADRVIQPAAANYSTTGSGADLRYERLIQAAAAQIAVSGSAEFTYTPNAQSYTIDAASAHIDINGSARLAVDRYLSAAQADYSITGAGVTLKADRLLDAAAAQYDITGSGVTLSAPIHYTLACDSAHIDINAHDAVFVWSGEPVVSRPDGGGRGKRILFRGRVYDSVRDRLYLAEALREVVEKRIEQPKIEPKRRKKSKTTALPQFTPAELVELPPVIDIARELDKKLADYVADLLTQQLAQEEEELFLMMAA